MRRDVALGLAVGVGVVLAGCGTSHPVATPRSTVTDTATAIGSAPTAPTTTFVPPTLPSPAATGPLTPTSAPAFPGTADEAIAAEAPDGTVFAVPGPRGGGTIAYVVDGTARPTVAEHLDAPAVAIAADSGTFYVSTAKDITAYDRTSGDAVRHWAVALSPTDDNPQDLALAGGRLWVFAAGRLIEIDPTSPAMTVVASPGRDVAGIAADATGAYLVEPGGHTLLHAAVDGRTSTVPTGLTIDENLSGPSAVTPVAVVGNTLVVSQHAGQGLDAQLVTYDATTLSKLAAAGTTIPGATVASTLGGPLVTGIGAPVCPGSTLWCVARVTLASAGTTSAWTAGAGQYVVSLLGPYPAVIVDSGANGQPGPLQLVRLH